MRLRELIACYDPERAHGNHELYKKAEHFHASKKVARQYFISSPVAPSHSLADVFDWFKARPPPSAPRQDHRLDVQLGKSAACAPAGIRVRGVVRAVRPRPKYG